MSKRNLPLLDVTMSVGDMPLQTPKASVSGLRNVAFKTMRGPELGLIDAVGQDMVTPKLREFQEKPEFKVVNKTK